MGPSAANKLDDDDDGDDLDDANNVSECGARNGSGGGGGKVEETHLLLFIKFVNDDASSALFLGPDSIF
jgi:hypothetical protein